MKYLFLFIGIIFFIESGFTQGSTTKSHPSKKEKRLQKKTRRDSVRQAKINQGKIIITPIVAPGYTPELRALVAVGALASFKTNPKDSRIQRSSFPITIAYTSTGAILANATLTSYWLHDKLRINSDFMYKDMPDHYWGIGYDKGYNTEKSDSTTAYTRTWWQFNPQFFYQIHQHYFIGFNLNYTSTKGSKESKGVLEDENYIFYNSRPLNSGLGVIFRYDSRDIPVDARHGFLFDFRSTFYSPKLGGDNKYICYTFDYRHALTLGRQGSTLAWQLKGRFTDGEVPYGEMSQIGTPFDLRGYTWGQYRDRQMLFLLTEYRYVIKKRNNKLSRHSFVTWLAGGKVFFRNITEDYNKWLPNAGIGYRLELQPRMYIRLDFGIGRKTYGFYLNFNQAF